MTSDKVTTEVEANSDNEIWERYKKTKFGLVPKEWKLSKLGEIGEFLKGKGVPKKEISDEGLPCLTYGEIYKYHNYVIRQFHSFIHASVAEESTELKYGDILFAGSGETLNEIGKSAAFIDDFPAFAGGDIIILRQSAVQPVFLGYLLNHEIVRRQLHKIGQGHSVVHIYSSGLSKVSCLIPPLHEQQKIATFLGTWDEAIQKCEQTIATLKTRNKGLAQQLLSGKKRLKGFEGEWEEYSLGEVAKRITRRNEELDDTVVTISAQRGFVRQEDFFKKRVASDTLSNYYLIHRGEFAYNKSYSNDYPMGAFKRLESSKKAVVTTLYICFSLKAGVSSDFMVHFFEAGGMVKNLMRIAQEGGRAHGLLNIGISDFFGLKLVLPEPKEQEAIAQVLNEADRELQLYQQKLTTLKDQKKGLMQKLLTGEVRVKTENA